MKPKRILIAAIHYPIASGRYIARALRRMGHDVRTIGPITGRKIWGIELSEGTEWLPSLPDPNWIPDLVISADSGLPYDSPYTCPHVVYGVDNHVRDYRLGVDYDHLFLAHGDGYRMDEDNVTHLPCAYDPEWHTDTAEWDDRMFEVGMVGVIYPERAELLQALSEEFSVFSATGLIMDDYRYAYNRIQISVCKSIDGDMAQRIFETAAMGCLILSDECHDFDKLGFMAWKHYIPYKTPQEAVENVRDVLGSHHAPDAAGMIARTKEWVEPHTWGSRCRVILETVFDE